MKLCKENFKNCQKWWLNHWQVTYHKERGNIERLKYMKDCYTTNVEVSLVI